GTPHKAPPPLPRPHSSSPHSWPSVYESVHPPRAPHPPAIPRLHFPPATRSARTTPLPMAPSSRSLPDIRRTRPSEFPSSSIVSAKFPAPSPSQSAHAAPLPPKPAAPSVQTDSPCRSVP